MGLEEILFLLVGGFAAGFIDSIAGGGGLISIPVLIFSGLPPQAALGTNKFQGSFGLLASAHQFVKHGTVRPRETIPGIIATLIGAVLGAWAVQQLDAGFVNHLIPFLLLLVLVYMLIFRDLGFRDQRARMDQTLFFVLFGLALGFYDGFFGPGTGSFWTMAIMVLLGFNMTRACGHTRIMNFVSTFVALFVFAAGGNIDYAAGLLMGAGGIAGARIGSGLAIDRGARFIRPVFAAVVLLTFLRLAYLNWF